MREGWDTAQVCQNGHMVNTMAISYPDSNEKFCSDCGTPTLMACPECQAAIRGKKHVPGILSTHSPPVKAYCHECGAAYPWTAARLEVGREALDEDPNLSDAEKEQGKTALEAVTRDTPRTELEAGRLKRVLDRLSGPTAQTMQKVVTEVAVDAAKKVLLGGP